MFTFDAILGYFTFDVLNALQLLVCLVLWKRHLSLIPRLACNSQLYDEFLVTFCCTYIQSDRILTFG